MSLAEAEMPTCLKEALVVPFIKKFSLDKGLLKNYRSVTSLSLLSKVVEKVVAGVTNPLHVIIACARHGVKPAVVKHCCYF